MPAPEEKYEQILPSEQVPDNPESMVASLPPSPDWWIQQHDTDLPKLKDCLDACEQEYWDLILRQTNGNIQKASQISGLSRSRLYVHFKRLNISLATLGK